jgi:hypothetical protein
VLGGRIGGSSKRAFGTEPTLDDPLMSSNPTSVSTEAVAVFGRLRPLIDTALIRQYRLPAQEAAEVRDRLLEWFRRFCQRPGLRSPEELETELLLMACRAGHVYSSGRVDEKQPDDRVQRSLALGPEIIAIEISKGHQEGDDA